MKKICVLGTIVADASSKWAESDVCPADVMAAFAEPDEDGVEIAINSPGGDVAGGLAICNMIKAARAAGVHTVAHVYGLAASMGSVIACAADELVMDEGSFLMVHNPWTYAAGNAEDLRKCAEELEKCRDAILGFYMTKFDRTADEIKTLLDEETWILGSEAETFGLKATVVPTGDFKAAACISRRAFDKAPEAARAFFTVQTEKPLTVEEKMKALEDKRASWQAAADKAKSELVAVRAELEETKARLAAVDTTISEANARAERAEADSSVALARLAEAEEKVQVLEARLSEAAAKAYAPDQSEADPWAKYAGMEPRQVLAQLPMSERMAYYHAHKDELTHN